MCVCACVWRGVLCFERPSSKRGACDGRMRHLGGFLCPAPAPMRRCRTATATGCVNTTCTSRRWLAAFHFQHVSAVECVQGRSVCWPFLACSVACVAFPLDCVAAYVWPGFGVSVSCCMQNPAAGPGVCAAAVAVSWAACTGPERTTMRALLGVASGLDSCTCEGASGPAGSNWVPSLPCYTGPMSQSCAGASGELLNSGVCCHQSHQECMGSTVLTRVSSCSVCVCV